MSEHDVYAIATVQLHPFHQHYVSTGTVPEETTQKRESFHEDIASLTSFRRKYTSNRKSATSKWFVPNFIPTSIVSNPKQGYIQNGSVIFKISITVVPDYTVIRKMSSNNSKMIPNVRGKRKISGSPHIRHQRVLTIPVERSLITDLTRLLDTKLLSDITLISNEKGATLQIEAHKTILAGSSLEFLFYLPNGGCVCPSVLYYTIL